MSAKTLRPYQRKNADEILGCLQRGVRRTIYGLPTGGGKTEVGAEVIRTVHGTGWSVTMTVHRRELLNNAVKTLRSKGIPARPVNKDYDPDPICPIHVASIDTLRSRKGRLTPWLESIHLVIPDEAHHCHAPGWQSVIDAMTNAQGLGLSATPYLGNGKPLGGIFDEAVRGPSVAELTAAGYLCPAEVWSPVMSLDLSTVKISRGDYVASDLDRIMNNDRITRLAINQYAARMPGEPCIVFCVSVNHARYVAAMFTAAGWKAVSVDGGMGDDDRDKAIEGLATGRVQILTSCMIVAEGTDIPVVSGAINLRPTKSVLLYQQQDGRALRTCYGKTRACIIDIAGNVELHGMPEADRLWTLETGLVPQQHRTIRCPVCHRRFAPAPSCPSCRREFRFWDRPATPLLAALADSAIRNMPTNELERIAVSAMDLTRIARVKGFNPGWVRHASERLRERQNERRRA